MGAPERGGGASGGPESRKGPPSQRSWVGVSRWPWESAGRASNCARSGWHGLVPRRRTAASPPLVQCREGGVRTPPNPGSHSLLPHPTSPWGWGSPRTKKEEGALLQQARGREDGGALCTHN